MRLCDTKRWYGGDLLSVAMAFQIIYYICESKYNRIDAVFWRSRHISF